MNAELRTILAEEKAALEDSRKRLSRQRLSAIARRNEYEITFLGDLLGYLDDALWNIGYELGTKPQRKGK